MFKEKSVIRLIRHSLYYTQFCDQSFKYFISNLYLNTSHFPIATFENCSDSTYCKGHSLRGIVSSVRRTTVPRPNSFAIQRTSGTLWNFPHSDIPFAKRIICNVCCIDFHYTMKYHMGLFLQAGNMTLL